MMSQLTSSWDTGNMNKDDKILIENLRKEKQKNALEIFC